MKGLLVILGFYACGMALHRYGHVPLPGNVIGMLLLTLVLVKGWVNVKTVEKAADFLLRHILLFFVPLIALGVAQYGGVLAERTALLLTALAAGPPIVMLVTGKVVERFLAPGREASRKSPGAAAAAGERGASHG